MLAKTDLELAGGDEAEVAAIKARVAGIKTVGSRRLREDVIAKAKLAGRAALTVPPQRPRATKQGT